MAELSLEHSLRSLESLDLTPQIKLMGFLQDLYSQIYQLN
jgi:hypothetical protein